MNETLNATVIFEDACRFTISEFSVYAASRAIFVGNPALKGAYLILDSTIVADEWVEEHVNLDAQLTIEAASSDPAARLRRAITAVDEWFVECRRRVDNAQETYAAAARAEQERQAQPAVEVSDDELPF